MKKNKWLLVLLVILIAIPSHAGKLVVEEDRDRLRFEDIEVLMIENNPTIQINNNVKRNLRDAKDAIRDAERDKRDIRDAIDDLEDAIDGMYDVIDIQDGMIDSLGGIMEMFPDPEEGIPPGEGMGPIPESPDDNNGGPDQNENETPPSQLDIIAATQKGMAGAQQGLIMGQKGLAGTQIGTLEFVKGLYQGNIASLEQNIEALENQLKEMEKLPAQELELDKTILQINMGNEGLVWGAKNLYLAYANLEKQRNELIRNLEIMEKQVDIMEVQKDLGMLIDLDFIEMLNQKEKLALGIKTMETQMDNLKRELNGMLGQEFNEDIELEDAFIVEDESIANINYEEDLKLAKKNSYAVQIKEYDYNIQKINTDWEDRHGDYDSYKTANRSLENADAELDEEVKNVELVFTKAYRELQNKILSFKTEKKHLEHERNKDDIVKLKYELGVISKMELEQAKSEYYSKSNEIMVSEQELFQMLIQYKELLKGMNYSQ